MALCKWSSTSLCFSIILPWIDFSFGTCIIFSMYIYYLFIDHLLDILFSTYIVPSPIVGSAFL